MQTLDRSRVRKALLTELTTFGVDDWLFVINVEVALIMGVVLRIYHWFAVALLLHFVLMIVTRVTPNIVQVYVRYMRQAQRYTSAYSPLQRRGLRPQGWGREEAH